MSSDQLDALLHQNPEQPPINKPDLEVLKELFNINDIETKSELSINQIILINQKRMLAKLLDWDDLNDCLNDFMLLMISKNRAGRTEFVDGFKGERNREIEASRGFFSGLGQKLGFR